MLDIGWAELLVIGALALIVVGPEDLPGMLRKAGRFVARARGMAREFQSAMEDAAREADLKDVTDFGRDLQGWKSGVSPRNMAKSFMDDDKPAKKAEAPAPGSLDAADAAENGAWAREQEEKRRAEELRAAEAKAAADAERLAAVNRSAAELEADIARETAPGASDTPRG